jgi:1-deoxyxylulose-5-phosphate synthase
MQYRVPRTPNVGLEVEENAMEYTRLGSSGLRVSRIALGTMGFGDGSRETWALGYDAAVPIFRQALDLDITFWDTANIYGFGSSETVVGRAIKELARRDDIVLATKVHQTVHPGPGGSGLSRKAIMEQIDASLTRLGTDYVDLYQIHRFDPDTPVEETMEALHDVVKAGKARYLGASSMLTWQFAKMQHAAQLHNWTRFVSMQDQYSLIQREDEREMFGLLVDQGVGSIPWSPLAGGMLARPWGDHSTNRSKDNVSVDFNGNPLWLDSDKNIIDAVQHIAEARGVSMGQVALAWALKHPVVDSPIVGATKEHHLADAAAAVDLKLTDDESAALEQDYVRRESTWF